MNFRIISILFLLVSIILLASTIFYRMQNSEFETTIRNLQQNETELQQKLQQLTEKLNEIQSAEEKHTEQPQNSLGVSLAHIIRLKNKGLKDPLKDLVKDLRAHPELIPYEGVLGGTMQFYFEDKIWVISNHWVLAYFEDGHRSGYALLEYKVADGGKISWKILASHD